MLHLTRELNELDPEMMAGGNPEQRRAYKFRDPTCRYVAAAWWNPMKQRNELHKKHLSSFLNQVHNLMLGLSCLPPYSNC